jgi:hypothetical protein
MNKFRNNLHAAFYDLNDNGEAYRETSDERSEAIEAVEQQTRAALDALADEIGKPDFSKISDSITRDKKNIEKEEDFKNNKERFYRRLQSLNPQ